jgi:hypothetical protein
MEPKFANFVTRPDLPLYGVFPGVSALSKTDVEKSKAFLAPAVRAAHREMMSVVDSLKLKALRVAYA